MTSVAVVDYETGNVHSVGRMLSRLGVPWVHTREEHELRSATHLLMPGVGHCAQAMQSLTATGMDAVLSDLVLNQGKPVLGICLGMHLMTSGSEEGATRCLGWFDADTKRLAPRNRRVFKTPNIGWHLVDAATGSATFDGIDVARQPFYFCHAYGVVEGGQQGVAATFDYESRYVAVLERDNLTGVQFHPEKSQEPGLALIRNFVTKGGAHV